MQIVTTLEEMDAKITECNDALHNESDDAMRRKFKEFRLDLSADLPDDPFSPAYRAFQMAVHDRITGKTYSLDNERTVFDIANYRHRPFPYYTGSTLTAGHHLQAIAFLLRNLDLPPGARVLEFGPGWGNTTITLALLGMRLTAVDIEPNFCEILRDRAAQNHVELDVVQADFFWAEGVTEPFDAVIFFECFHHCDDHMRLLRALHTAVKPDGIVVIASEPINPEFTMPWGVRPDGEALWAMRNFGWLELGFRETYFDAALARTGWRAEKRTCPDLDWASVWIARAAEPDPAAQEYRPPPPEAVVAAPSPPAPVAEAPAEDPREAELRSVYASTSWRVTAPLRALRRLLP